MNPLPPGTVRAPRPPAPPLSPEEATVERRFDAADELPEVVRARALNDVLRWLAEDAEWARETESLGEDVALGIDHARRLVQEMSR